VAGHRVLGVHVDVAQGGGRDRAEHVDLGRERAQRREHLGARLGGAQVRAVDRHEPAAANGLGDLLERRDLQEARGRGDRVRWSEPVLGGWAGDLGPQDAGADAGPAAGDVDLDLAQRGRPQQHGVSRAS
jgi:hypothetical protein